MNTLIFGDFNLPKFNWAEQVASSHPLPNYNTFLKFISDNLLSQYIEGIREKQIF